MVWESFTVTKGLHVLMVKPSSSEPNQSYSVLLGHSHCFQFDICVGAGVCPSNHTVNLGARTHTDDRLNVHTAAVTIDMFGMACTGMHGTSVHSCSCCVPIDINGTATMQMHRTPDAFWVVKHGPWHRYMQVSLSE